MSYYNNDIILDQIAEIEALKAERDTLLADNARLREAIACGVKIIESYIINYGHSQVLAGLRNSHRELLSATPEQSLARYHNEVLEKAAKKCDREPRRFLSEYERGCDDMANYLADELRTMKEPE